MRKNAERPNLKPELRRQMPRGPFRLAEYNFGVRRSGLEVRRSSRARLRSRRFGVWGMGKMPGAGEWGILIVLGVLQLGVSYILYGVAIRHVSAIEGILIPMLEPVLNPVWVFIFLGEKPGAWTVAGAALVLAAMLTRGLLGMRRTRK